MIGKRILADARRLHPTGHHPRILMGQEDFDRLQGTREDPLVALAITNLKNQAQIILEKAPCTYDIPDGIRLLVVSRAVLARVSTLAMLYRLEGQECYAKRAYEELAAAAAFPDFHPYHFLDTAELCAAFAIGYDWLYDWMSEEQRAPLRDAMYQYGILAGLDDYTYNAAAPRTYRWFKDKPGDNWKLVCNGGLSMAILAIFDELDNDALYERMLTLAFEDSMEAVLTFYSGDDGTYSEGPSYWSYATDYLSYFSDTLTSCCGTDYGLTDWKGLRLSPFSLLSLASNNHQSFNFGDAWRRTVSFDLFFWFAHRYGDRALSTLRCNHLRTHPSEAGLSTLRFYRPALVEEGDVLSTLPITYGAVGGDNASFRSGWGEEDIYAAIHFGKNNAYHGHLDMGTFVLYVGSTCFFHDLGPDNYNLKPYNGTYRYRAEGHNVLVINPTPEHDQKRDAAAVINRYAGEGELSYAISDISAAYPGKQVTRGLALCRASRTVYVQDEIVADGADEIYWSAHTTAEVEIGADERHAVLREDGKTLYAYLDGDGRFALLSAQPTDRSPKVQPAPSENDATPRPQRTNEGICKLSVALLGKTEYTLRVTFCLEEREEGAAVDVRSLSCW